MKTLMKRKGLLPSVVIPVILLCAACSDPVTDLENNGTDTTDILTGNEADRIFDSFKFKNGLLKHSCHLLVITAGVEGSKEVRMYVRHPSSDVWED